MTGNPPSTSDSQRSIDLHGPLRILFAAESAVEQKLASGILAKHGHRVYLAGNGQEAIRGCTDNEIDVVILDPWICDGDGPDVIGEIRKREKSTSRRVPILTMIGEDQDGSPPADADGRIDKPLRMEQLIACLETALCLGQPAEKQQSSGEGGNDVDWTVALEAVGGRQDLLHELVEIFFAEYPVTLEAIRTSIAKQDAQGVRLYAHKLKGCLRYFGTSEASELAAELEEIGRRSDLESAPHKLERLVAATNQLLPALKAGPGRAESRVES